MSGKANNLLCPQRVIIVGCGAIAREFYTPALRTLEAEGGAEVVALMDPTPSRLSEMGIAFPKAQQMNDLSQALLLEPGLAIVASPPSFHCPQVVSLLEQGFDVLCEKPMAGSVAECKKMLSAAKKTEQMLAVALFRRFFPSTALVRELVRGRALGRPLSFSWSEGGVFNWPAASASFFSKSSSQGGVLADLGVHVFDLLLHWFGAVSDVQYEDDAMGGLETNARLQLRFASGVEGSVRVSRDTNIPVGAQIVFEKGTVGLRGASANQVYLSINGCESVIDAHLLQRGDGDRRLGDFAIDHALSYQQSFVEQLRNFCRAIQGKEPLRVPGTEALQSMELIEKCYASKRSMKLPWLSPKEQVAVLSMQS